MNLTQKLGATVFALATALSPLIAGASEHEQTTELDGVWRGVLTLQENVHLALGITIENGQLTLDSPNQGMFDREPTDFTITADTVSFSDSGLSAQYHAELQDGALVGTFSQGDQRSLTLHRLDEADRERMKFEGLYAGELIINGRNELPLRLNIAVLHANGDNGEYLATLDSPAQQSFGIPVETVEISEQRLSFSSPLIQATFEGQHTDEGYEGSFIQGQVRPLTLKKVEEGEELAEVPKPEPGQHGGALAVLTRSEKDDYEVSTEFFQGHNEDTLYEIGSVTKTMVGYVLAALAEEGVVNESTPVAEFFAEADGSITLEELATHHSGLPRLPATLFEKADAHDPYAHFGETQLRESLAETEIGDKAYLYSNYGFGLLGEALAKADQTDFASLLETRLFQPAGMSDSHVAISDGNEAAFLAQGHDSLGDEVKPWRFQSLAGAGAVVSNLADMVEYARFMLNGVNNEAPATLRMLESRYPMSACCNQALGWILQDDDRGNTMAWHAGQTGGFNAYIGFYLDGSAAVVFLNNQSVDHSAAMHRKLWETLP